MRLCRLLYLYTPLCSLSSHIFAHILPYFSFYFIPVPDYQPSRAGFIQNPWFVISIKPTHTLHPKLCCVQSDDDEEAERAETCVSLQTEVPFFTPCSLPPVISPAFVPFSQSPSLEFRCNRARTLERCRTRPVSPRRSDVGGARKALQAWVSGERSDNQRYGTKPDVWANTDYLFFAVRLSL